MYDRLQLTNMLRSEVERIPETGLPLEVFPARIQELVLNLARYENFNVEYTASILLSAVATAIGNSCRIRIKGEWKTSPSIYMMLVGRPGLARHRRWVSFTNRSASTTTGCTRSTTRSGMPMKRRLPRPEPGAAVRPEDCTLLRKPQLVTTVISDFTPEAMMSIHQHNPRGIALVVDEIRALFNSVKRYNNRNNLIEDLLTAYSGQPLKVIRKSEARPILIRNPCINIIGSVQPNLLPEIFRAEYMTNGLLDRFLFVYPKDRRISGWKRDDGAIARPDMVGQWREVLDRIVSLPYPAGAVLNMADDAEEYFYNWYNGIIEEVNAIEDDAEVESRKMKLNGNAARLSLVFQVLKWATDGDGMQCVDLESVQAAIRMIGYYEETYRRIQELIVASNIGESKEAWLSLLGNTFTAGDAIVAGKRVELSRRSVYYALKQLCSQPNPLLEKIDHGTYRQTLSEQTGCTLHYCTFGRRNGGAGGQSAKVQCANDENPRGHE